MSVWETLGRPPAFRLVELGPGKGTLMRDLLHAASAFPDFKKVPRRRLAAGPMHGMISTEPSGGGGRVALPPAFLYLRCVRAAAAFFITDSPPHPSLKAATVHLVETSPHLREKQHAALGALPKEPAASAPAASAEAKEGKAEASVGANKGGSAAKEE